MAVRVNQHSDRFADRRTRRERDRGARKRAAVREQRDES